jgi:hypothetical protein
MIDAGAQQLSCEVTAAAGASWVRRLWLNEWSILQSTVLAMLATEFRAAILY